MSFVFPSGWFISSDKQLIHLDVNQLELRDQSGVYPLCKNKNTFSTHKGSTLVWNQQLSCWEEKTKKNTVRFRAVHHCNQCVKPYVIGIGGATRAGKGTLAHQLAEKYQTSTICIDEVFDRAGMKTCAFGHNKETPHALNWKEFMKRLEYLEVKKTFCRANQENFVGKVHSNVIIVEGFLLLVNPIVLERLDVMIFLHVPREICYQRRMTTKRVAEEYFNSVIWPCYLTYNRQILDHIGDEEYPETTENTPYWFEDISEFVTRIFVINGTLEPSQILQQALQHINETLKI